MNLKKLCTTFILGTLITSCNMSQKQESLPSKILKISTSEDPTALDPRKIRTLTSINIVRMLFDGLTQVDNQGNPILALAEKVDISEDKKVYTFHLKQSNWSDGTPLTAHDFEYAWKYQLNRENGAPNAYQLFVLKNAKTAYEGNISLDEVGVQAQDSQTLTVHLENPTPYFLQLAATYPFFPVCKAFAEMHNEWKENDQFVCISNGPFCLDTWQPHTEIRFKKNAQYWNANNVKLDTVQFSTVDDLTAVNMFEQTELDWVGSPCSIIPQDMIEPLKASKKIHTQNACGTQFIRVNCQKTGLNNANIRKALALAIDTQNICDHILQANQLPATHLVPPIMNFNSDTTYTSYDTTLASKYLEQGLAEIGCKKEQFPTFSLTFTANERIQKIAQAIQENWKQVLGIQVELQPFESKSVYERIFTKKYDMAIGSWFADFMDPVSFLSVFQYKENGTNNTEWSNNEYTKLLEQSNFETDQVKRMQSLASAEKILINDMPILPLFHFTFSYLKNPNVENISINPLGYIECSNAQFKDVSIQ